MKNKINNHLIKLNNLINKVENILIADMDDCEICERFYVIKEIFNNSFLNHLKFNHLELFNIIKNNEILKESKL